MALPTSTTNGATATINGIVYTYNSTKGAWYKQSTASTNVPVTISGSLSVSGNANVGNLGTASATLTGNLNFSGTGLRITGDMSNATVANRVAFQTSTTNGQTRLTILSNGTNIDNALDLFPNTTGLNTSRFSMRINLTDAAFISTLEGTGSYLPMTFYTGGSERMRIDTSGNVGIGTASPSTQFEVSNTSTTATITSTATSGYSVLSLRNTGTSGRAWQVAVGGSATGVAGSYYVYDATAAAVRMLIDSSGNVGIGTSSPNTSLQVYKAATSAFTGTSPGALLLTDSTNTLNYFTSIDFNTTNAPSVPYARIGMSYTSGGSKLSFGTSNSYASGITNTAMTIDPTGNVGIGTASPTTRLSVVSSTNGGINVNDGTVNTILYNTSSLNGTIGTTTNHPFAFYTNNTEKMRIDAGGNLIPSANVTYNLGSATARWANVYVGDLSLSNGIGDWTIVEGEDDLFIYNNKKNKVYKFNLTEVDPSVAPPKLNSQK
jgi:hypothetical protein